MTDLYGLDTLVIEALETATGKAVGYAAVPGPRPAKPYAIVTPYGGPAPAGDMADRSANRDHRYQIRCVGIDPRQVRWLEKKVDSAMLGMTSTLGAQWVLPEVSGAIVPDGADLYSSMSTYIVRI